MCRKLRCETKNLFAIERPGQLWAQQYFDHTSVILRRKPGNRSGDTVARERAGDGSIRGCDELSILRVGQAGKLEHRGLYILAPWVKVTTRGCVVDQAISST